MKRKYVETLILVGLSLISISSFLYGGWARSWGEVSEDIGYCVEETDDGAYLVAAEKNGQVWLLKIDAEGDSLWSDIQIEEGTDAPYEIHQTSDGNYIVVGKKSMSLWLGKIDSIGNFIWDARTGNSGEVGYSVVETPDRGFLVTGQTLDFGDGYQSLWLVKTDANGNTEWHRTYDEWGDDYGNHVIQTADGGYVITGACHGSSIIDGELKYDVWIIRLDENFDTVWARSYGDEMINERGHAVAETDDGFLVCADMTSGWSDLWLLRLDNSGDTVWTKKFGMLYSTEIGYSMQPASDGNYIITGKLDSGTTANDLWLLKVDADGSELFSKTYVGDFDDCGYWAEETNDGGFIITGYTETSEDDGDVWLIKTDAQGDTLVTSIYDRTYTPDGITIISPIGSEIVLRYQYIPDGFHADVFDASGRKIDELHSDEASGIIQWGEGFGPGVYFVRQFSGGASHKVVLVR